MPVWFSGIHDKMIKDYSMIGITRGHNIVRLADLVHSFAGFAFKNGIIAALVMKLTSCRPAKKGV